MQGASRKSGSPPCSHAGVGGDASCLSPSPCEMLPGLQAFPCMPGRKNHEAKPHVTSPSATPEAKPRVPPPAPTPPEGIPTAWLAHRSWMLPLSHDSRLLSSIQTGPCPCGTPGQQGQQITLPRMALYQQTLDRCGAVPVPAARDRSSPCLHPAERKNSLERGKY